MDSILIPIDQIYPSPWNPKLTFTKKEIEALRRSITKWGFARDLIVAKRYDYEDGYYCLDGHTALDLLKERETAEVSCKVIDEVTDLDSLTEFISAYNVRKKNDVNEIYKKLGTNFEAVYGKSAQFFEKAAEFAAMSFHAPVIPQAPKQSPAPERTPEARAAVPSPAAEAPVMPRQSQYFLTLPTDTVEKCKALAKSKIWNVDKTQALLDRIDKMDDTAFLQGLLAAILQ